VLENELSGFGKLVAISKIRNTELLSIRVPILNKKIGKLGSRAKITVLVQFLGILERSYFTRYKSD
jgi:hypothetical protein